MFPIKQFPSLASYLLSPLVPSPKVILKYSQPTNLNVGCSESVVVELYAVVFNMHFKYIEYTIILFRFTGT